MNPLYPKFEENYGFEGVKRPDRAMKGRFSRYLALQPRVPPFAPIFSQILKKTQFNEGRSLPDNRVRETP